MLPLRFRNGILRLRYAPLRMTMNYCSIINSIDRPPILIGVTARNDAILDFHIPFHPRPPPFVPPIPRKRKWSILRHGRALHCQSGSDFRRTHMNGLIIFQQHRRFFPFSKPPQRNASPHRRAIARAPFPLFVIPSENASPARTEGSRCET